MTDYAADFLARANVIALAESATRVGVRNPIVYVNTKVRKHGPIFRYAYAEALKANGAGQCTAVTRDLIDAALCARFGWCTIADWRTEKTI